MFHNIIGLFDDMPSLKLGPRLECDSQSCLSLCVCVCSRALTAAVFQDGLLGKGTCIGTLSGTRKNAAWVCLEISGTV